MATVETYKPIYLKDILHLESVQRSFTKRLPGLKYESYGVRLQLLNLPSLELRRLQHDLIFCFKILNGLVAGPTENYGLILANCQSRGHNKNYLLIMPELMPEKDFLDVEYALHGMHYLTAL